MDTRINVKAEAAVAWMSCGLSLLRVALLAVAVVTAMTVRGVPVPQMPESDLSWRNVRVDAKKTAVFCIFRDSRGLMWFGTNSGLYFYDGVNTHAVGERVLMGTQVYAVVEKDRRLYIGSNNGLFVYDYDSGVVTRCDVETPNEIRALLLVDDALWIGGLNGIYCLDLRRSEICNCSKGLPHKSVYTILRDSRGIMYAGTYAGLARWDSRTRRFTPLAVRDEASDRPAVLFVNCLMESVDRNDIYVGGEHFLYRYTPASDHWERISQIGSNNVKSLCNGDAGHIFVGTDNGVYDIHGDTVRLFRHDSRQELSLADNEIWCIYADHDHNLWAGHERGVSIASNSKSIRTIKLSTLAHSGEGNEIYTIYRDSRHNLWFSGSNGAIRLSADGSPHWYRHGDAANTLSHNRVRDIYEDSDNVLWFATDGGINRYDSARDRFDVFHVTDSNGAHTSNWVYALVEDGTGFWVGSFLNGLQRVDKSKFGQGTDVVVSDLNINADTPGARLSLSNNLVNDMIRDRRGNIWVLLYRDSMLSRLHPDAGGMTRYDILDIAGAYPTHISLDRQGRVWCGFTGGAVVFDGDGSHRVVRFPSDSSDESIFAMGPVGDNMWISTRSNVWNVDGHTLESRLLPIPQKPYTAVYEDVVSGKVYLGGTDEILEVDKHIIDNSPDYKTIRMVLNDRGGGVFNLSDIQAGTRGLTIPYGGSVTLVVSSLDYSPETVQRYMYKLADSANDTVNRWVVMPEGANTITFSDLKMGDYVLLVKTVGSPDAPLSIPLTVEPPLVLSWWAILLYIIVIAAIVCWTVWYLRRRQLRSFRERERQAALDNVERKLSFLSNISHDLKTPLSMIIGPVSLMKERARDPENKKSLEQIYENAVRLNNMIHRTIELEHLDGQDENMLILSVFDAVEFCRGIFDVFRENNPQKNFVFHSSSTQILIEADAVKFESVITNLLSNACKYSDDGATISCGVTLHDDKVEIVVSDDGVGISDSDQSLVFQRMFRSPATSKLREGTGLGLYLIKKYLELMDGNIYMYSKEGQGTSFVVTLPVADGVSRAIQHDVDTGDNDKAKILVVEDNAQISEFIVDMLRDRFTLLTAENGSSGLAIAASFMPDLIIVDEMMPVMSGLDMVRRLKQNPRLSATPIIMLTAKSDNKTETESIKLGVDIFMTKPFEPASLLARISQLLKGRTEIKERVRIQTIAEAESKPIEAETYNEKSLARVAKIIEDCISDPDLKVSLLCEKSGIPNKQLYRLIKKYMGMSPIDYIRSVRLQKAAVLLSQHRFTVAEISYMVGFKTPSYFAKCFQNQYGVKPSQYQSDDSNI